MANQPRYRLARPEPLVSGQRLQLSGNEAHYLLQVLRMKEGDRIGLFNRTDGAFDATLTTREKRSVTLTIGQRLRQLPLAYSSPRQS